MPGKCFTDDKIFLKKFLALSSCLEVTPHAFSKYECIPFARVTIALVTKANIKPKPMPNPDHNHNRYPDPYSHDSTLYQETK